VEERGEEERGEEGKVREESGGKAWGRGPSPPPNAET